MKTMIKPFLPNNRNSKLFAEMLRYGFVSVAALVVDTGGLILLKNWSLSVLLAATLSFTAGLIVNFIMSRKWAFAAAARVNPRAEFIIFTVIGLTGLVLNDGIIYLCNSIFGLHYLLSKAISVALVFFWNFLLRRYLLYTGSRQGKEE